MIDDFDSFVKPLHSMPLTSSLLEPTDNNIQVIDDVSESE